MANRTRYWLDVFIALPVIIVISMFEMLPMCISRFGGRILGYLVHILRIRRRALKMNLGIAFPELPAKVISRMIREISVNFGDFMGEWLAMPRNKDLLEKRARCVGIEILEEGLKQGRGVLVCSAHLGNWEMLASITARLCSRPLTIIRQRLKNRWLDRWFTRMHQKMGYGDIVRSKSALDIYRKLKRNEVVGMLVDQSGRSAGMWVPFFGRPTSFHRGPGVLASRTGCCVVAAFCAADRDGWVIEFSQLAIAYTGDIEKDTEQLMKLYAQKLEAAIRANPAWYFWYHRRWKTKIPADVQAKWELR